MARKPTQWTQWLRGHRRARGWTTAEAARQAGVSFHTWQTIERDEVEPQDSTLDKIADAIEQSRTEVHAWHRRLSGVSS